MTAFVVYPLLTAALFYLGSRALVTSWLWSRYPRRLAQFMDCPYCTGFWYGLLVAIVGGYSFDLPFGSLVGNEAGTVIVVGVCSIMWTPIVASLAHQAHMALGSVLEAEASSEPISSPDPVPEPIADVIEPAASSEENDGRTS